MEYGDEKQDGGDGRKQMEWLFEEESKPLVYAKEWNLWVKRKRGCWGKDQEEGPCSREEELPGVVVEE